MGVLTRKQIIDSVALGELHIDPFDKELVQPASYDLRLHGKILASPLGPNTLGEMVHLTDDKPTFEIQSGQMVGVLSVERFTFPLTLAGRFGIKSDFARKGIIAFGGLQLDPGWRGRLILNLLNVGPEPISIKKGEPLFSVEFHQLDEPTNPYGGPQQDQDDFKEEQIQYILSARTTSLAEIPTFRQQIARLSVLMQELADKLPDPDEGFALKAQVERTLRDSLKKPRAGLLSPDQIKRKLNL
jgi:dCTP deaminase